MKYSHLVPLITLLLSNFGEIQPDCYTDFQEDCAGEGALSAGVSHFGFRAQRRDVPGTELILRSSVHWLCGFGFS